MRSKCQKNKQLTVEALYNSVMCVCVYLLLLFYLCIYFYIQLYALSGQCGWVGDVCTLLA